jgi:hypothetical protein
VEEKQMSDSSHINPINSWRNMKQYRKLNKLVNSLEVEERIALNSYFISGAGPLEKGVNLNNVVEFLASRSIDEVQLIVEQAMLWAKEQELNADTVPANHDVERQINFTLNVADKLDPTSVIVLSRDIGDADRLTLQEINVDNGDYIPVPPAAMAEILRNFADSIMERQEEINRASGNL